MRKWIGDNLWKLRTAHAEDVRHAIFIDLATIILLWLYYHCYTYMNIMGVYIYIYRYRWGKKLLKGELLQITEEADMEIEKKSVEMESGEVTEKKNQKKAQQRRGGIRTLPFILGQITFYYSYYFIILFSYF